MSDTRYVGDMVRILADHERPPFDWQMDDFLKEPDVPDLGECRVHLEAPCKGRATHAVITSLDGALTEPLVVCPWHFKEIGRVPSAWRIVATLDGQAWFEPSKMAL